MSPALSWLLIGAVVVVAFNATWLLVSVLAWMDEKLIEHDNGPAGFDAHRTVSTDPAKETA